MMTDDRDVLRTMSFCQGLGTENKSGCWGAMLNLWAGGTRWEATHKCIDPTINQLCIQINDALSDENRTRIIMAFGPLDPLGTAGDEAATERRRFRLIDAALREWYPLLFDLLAKHIDKAKRGACEAHAAAIRAMSPIVDLPTLQTSKKTVRRAGEFAYANAIAIANAYAYANANANAYAYANANANAIANAYAYAYAIANAYANAYAYAYAYAYAIANANANARDDFIVSHALPVLRELIEMGPHAPVERAGGADRLLAQMGRT
jgi:hypothetical protein